MSTKKLVLILLTVLFCFRHPTTNAEQQPLRIAYPTFTPFHWIDESGEMKGIFYDIITEALQKRMGIPLVWRPFPWARCQQHLKNGRVDAILTFPTPERLFYARSSKRPFYSKSQHLFTYNNHPRIDQVKQINEIIEIKAMELAVITYSGNGWHKTNVQSLGIKTYESSNLENVWQMLAHKRGDVVIEWPPAAKPTLKRLGLEKEILDTGINLSTIPFHLLINKKSTHLSLLEEFDTVIDQMQQDGTISSIVDRY
ncbi:substrate-binding periplasmic protein [Desulfogranum marinum]|uniref:substrate-binding periplasmic protein n=1 Tax=Desulfogranum marinum TaxID=453220 RepID=UPI001965CF92|nr:transporter substrate-binding domain-containing protein [Desulfogranum marinum]MBM9512945.1 transporter substrate-binding domain-containing protein [Desulfogranum marinum]